MTTKQRVLLLVLIMVGVVGAATGTALWALYDAAFEEQRARLTETAQSWARLIEAVARHEARYGHLVEQEYGRGSPLEATFDQVREAHEGFKGFGRTGEFTLAKREGDDIVFLLSHRHFDLADPEPVPFVSHLAEPERETLRE